MCVLRSGKCDNFFSFDRGGVSIFYVVELLAIIEVLKQADHLDYHVQIPNFFQLDTRQVMDISLSRIAK